MKFIIWFFLIIGLQDCIDAVFELIEYLFQYCKERRQTNMAKQKEQDIYGQVEDYLVPIAKARQCKGGEYTLTQPTMHGYAIRISLVADNGESLLNLLK